MNPPSCPPPPLIIKGGEELPKIRGGGCHFFITLQFNPIYCVFVCVFVVEGGRGDSLYYFLDLQSFQLVMQDSHSSLYCTDTWYHLHISDPFW